MNGYIYALYYNNKPFYIGQSLNPDKRYKSHYYACFSDKHHNLYNFIRTITTKDNYFNDITIKIVKECHQRDLNHYEKECIRYCIYKGATLYNDCVYTIHTYHTYKTHHDTIYIQ